jgi:putative redox protein
MALLNRNTSSETRSMRAVARQREKLAHDVKAGDHTFTVDEPIAAGGDDLGPSPQELLAAALASCTAVTMEMYAQRKGWDTSGLAVDVEYTPAERGCPTKFELVLKLPAHLDEDQMDKLRVIAAKCPVHRTLEGEVMFHERVELA